MCRQVAISQRNICSTIWRVYDYAERSRRNVPVVNELEARFRIVGNAGYWTLCRIRHSVHAAEQLKSGLDARYGENDSRGRAQFHKLRHLLLDDPDGVEKVIRALAYQRKRFPRRTRIGEVLRYFRRNRHRMRYADTQARHLPIGSGVVEAACKTLVTQRLKRSGMRWRRAGGQAILTLRSLLQSSRFEQAWGLLSKTYRQDVTVPDNVVAFPRNRAA